MENFDYTVETTKSVDETVAPSMLKAGEGLSSAARSRCAGHALPKGFESEPMKIVEVCTSVRQPGAGERQENIADAACPISVLGRQVRLTSAPSSHGFCPRLSGQASMRLPRLKK